MNKESLDKVITLIINSDIILEDKLELVINLMYMFESYEENINYLREKEYDKKKKLLQ